jgi:hypothetical protein
MAFETAGKIGGSALTESGRGVVGLEEMDFDFWKDLIHAQRRIFMPDSAPTQKRAAPDSSDSPRGTGSTDSSVFISPPYRRPMLPFPGSRLPKASFWHLRQTAEL